MFEIEPITKYLNLLHRLPWLHTKYLSVDIIPSTICKQ